MPLAPHPPDEAARLAALRRYAVLDTPAEPSFDDIARLASFVCGAPMAMVSFVDADRVWHKAVVGDLPQEVARHESFCTRTVEGLGALIVDDATRDSRFATNRHVMAAGGVRFYAGVPLRTHDGYALGSLCVVDLAPRTLSPAQQSALEALGRQTVALLDGRLTVLTLEHEAIERAAAEQGRARMSAILDSTTDIVGHASLDGKVTYLNFAGRRMLGLSENAPLDGVGFSDLHPPWARRLLLEQALPAALEHGVWHGESAVVSGVALETPVSQVIIAHRTDDGAMDFFSTVMRDITAQKRAAERLQLSEMRFRRLSDASADGIAILTDGVVAEVNRSFCVLFGYEEREVIGRRAEEFAAAGERARVESTVAGHVEGRYETICVRKDGTTFPAEIRAKHIDYQGISARVTVIRDISERRAVDRLKNEFVSTVSHELRTPLTSIRGSLGLIEGGVTGPVSPQSLELVRIARANADRLIRLINDILDLEKMEAGKLELRIVALDAVEVMTTALEGIQALADARSVRLRAHIAHYGEFPGDRDRIIQVLTNLLSNAIAFSDSGGEVTLRVATASDGQRLRFTIDDHGPGIPADQLDQLFRKFNQLDASDTRRKGGSGLGLAISRSIVQQHGGEIGVESEPGKLTRFWVELPGATPVPDAASAALERDTPLVALVITGDVGLAAVLDVHLANGGYHLLHAATLADARRTVAQVRPSVMVLDHPMPDGSGSAFVRELQATRSTAGIPVVVLSSHSRDSSIAAPPLTEWLAKPTTEALLVRAIRRAVRRPAPPRALVVDDDTAVRTVVIRTLQPLGVECHEATDGQDALRAVRAEAPDIIVLDVDMPRMNGFALVATLRSEAARATPMVVYTSHDLTAEERQALTLGESRHLTKARATQADLARVVEELLGDLPRTAVPRGRAR